MANSTSRGRKRASLGSKKEVSPGVWQVRVSVGYRPDGGQRRGTEYVHGDERDADTAILRLAASMRKNVNLGRGTDLDTYFWVQFAPGRRASTTRANAETCESVYRCHIGPHFGRWPMDKIDNREIQRWIYTLPPQSADTYVRVMRTVMTQAHFDHVIDENPMGSGYNFKYPRGKDTTPLPVWGVPEVLACLERLRGHRLFALWCVMTGGGASRSEALALDWEDMTFAPVLGLDGTEHMVAMAPVTKAVTSRDGEKEPKNARRYRTMRIQPPFSDELYAMRGSGPICVGRQGGRMSANYLPKVWKRLFRKGDLLHGLPFVGINRMRATNATMMQSAGVDSTIINAMQGRSRDSKVLYSNYLSPYQETFDSAGRAMTGVLYQNATG